MSLYVGQVCRISPARWAVFLRDNGMDMTAVLQPQPITDINSVNGRVLLAFPYWWWEPEDILPCEKT